MGGATGGGEKKTTKTTTRTEGKRSNINQDYQTPDEVFIRSPCYIHVNPVIYMFKI